MNQVLAIQGYIKGMDKDGDGLLSLEEAVSSITEIEGLEHPDHPEILEEKKRHVQKLTDNFKKSVTCLAVMSNHALNLLCVGWSRIHLKLLKLWRRCRRGVPRSMTIDYFISYMLYVYNNPLSMLDHPYVICM